MVASWGAIFVCGALLDPGGGTHIFSWICMLDVKGWVLEERWVRHFPKKSLNFGRGMGLEHQNRKILVGGRVLSTKFR